MCWVTKLWEKERDGIRIRIIWKNWTYENYSRHGMNWIFCKLFSFFCLMINKIIIFFPCSMWFVSENFAASQIRNINFLIIKETFTIVHVHMKVNKERKINAIFQCKCTMWGFFSVVRAVSRAWNMLWAQREKGKLCQKKIFIFEESENWKIWEKTEFSLVSKKIEKILCSKKFSSFGIRG